MRTVPPTVSDKITFYQAHLAVWTEHADAIGTSPEAVEALEALTTAAFDAVAEQRRAQEKAQSATLKAQMAVEALSAAGATIIAGIRATASRNGDGVYQLASITPPAKPAPIGPPGTPTSFTSRLLNEGAIELKWKCPNPAGATGTIYQVWRRIDSLGETAFAYIGGTGTRKFVDATLPAGTGSVTYQLQAVRSTQAGPWAQYNVTFGGVHEGAKAQHAASFRGSATRLHAA